MKEKSPFQLAGIHFIPKFQRAFISKLGIKRFHGLNHASRMIIVFQLSDDNYFGRLATITKVRD